MNSGTKLELRRKLCILGHDSLFLLYNPLWRRPVLVNEKLLALVKYFGKPRGLHELTIQSEAVAMKLKELEDAGILGPAGTTDEDTWRSRHLPGGSLLLPNKIIVHPGSANGRRAGDCGAELSGIANALLERSDGTIPLVFMTLETPEHWEAACGLLEALWERLDLLDYLDIFADARADIVNPELLNRLRWFALGVRLRLSSSDPGRGLRAIEQLLEQGDTVLPVVQQPEHGGLAEILDRIAEQGIARVWVEPPADLLQGAPDEVVTWVEERRKDCADRNLELLGFWDLPALVFERRVLPAACYLSLHINVETSCAVIGGTTLPLVDLTLDRLDVLCQGMAASLPPPDCFDCFAIGLCMGTIRRKYAHAEAVSCRLTHQMFGSFLEQQLLTAAGETS